MHKRVADTRKDRVEASVEDCEGSQMSYTTTNSNKSDLIVERPRNPDVLSNNSSSSRAWLIDLGKTIAVVSNSRRLGVNQETKFTTDEADVFTVYSSMANACFVVKTKKSDEA